MILTTTPTIEGCPIRQYVRLITAETIIGANAVRDMFASFRDVFGGRVDSYEEVLKEAKHTALHEIEQQAMQLGANAVVGIDFDYETLGQNNSILMVAASGTAVII